MPFFHSENVKKPELFLTAPDYETVCIKQKYDRKKPDRYRAEL